MFLAIDDTDSRFTGCTTFVALRLIEALRPYCQLLSYPDLVRLNPCCQSKTRGNAAILLEFGYGTPVKTIGQTADGTKIILHQPDETRKFACSEFLKLIIQTCLVRHRALGSNTTVILSDKKEDSVIYSRCVTEILSMNEFDHLQEDKTIIAFGTGEGLIGCFGALGWDHKRVSFELLGYRLRSNWKTSRYIEKESFFQLKSTHPDFFGNDENNRLCIAPSTPCPVLFGIRSWSDCFQNVIESLVSEPISEWLIFRTNQASDDHILPYSGELKEFSSYHIHGYVKKIDVVRGRHRILMLQTTTASIRCVIFERTGLVATHVSNLYSGDEIEVFGSFIDGQINVEKIFVHSLKIPYEKISNPVCQSCQRRMKSSGRLGYRCQECKFVCSKDHARYALALRTFVPQLIGPSVLAARHLSSPAFYRISDNA